MCSWVKLGPKLIFVTVSVVLAGDLTRASDLSEWLWGGRGSRTTVTDPYIPPPLVTDTTSVSLDSTGRATTPSNLMLGTSGAMTLPPGGVISSNGVASTGVSTGTYVIPAQWTTASNIIPAVQVIPQQPVIEYEWTYSTIKDVTYEPVTVYDPRLGGYVTTMQEKQTESVLPWLHRKQVVRYKPATNDTLIDSPTISSTSPAISNPSERYIVNRLFPVSAVPSPPAQAVPVQTFPLYAGSMTTYASESTGTRVVLPSDSPALPPSTLPPTESVVMRIDSVSPVVTTLTPAAPSPFDLMPQQYSTTITSQQTDLTSLSPGIVSTSAHQVLYPIIPEIGVSSPSINTTGNTSSNRTPGNVPTDSAFPQTSTPSVPSPQTPISAAPAVQTPVSPRAGSSPNKPTLAPDPSVPTPDAQETVLRPTIQESLSASERSQPVELQPGQQLPPPAQLSPIPSIETPSTGSVEVPQLVAPGTESSSSSATPTTSPARPRPDLSNSPTRMPPRMSPLSN